MTIKIRPMDRNIIIDSTVDNNGKEFIIYTSSIVKGSKISPNQINKIEVYNERKELVNVLKPEFEIEEIKNIKGLSNGKMKTMERHFNVGLITEGYVKILAYIPGAHYYKIFLTNGLSTDLEQNNGGKKIAFIYANTHGTFIVNANEFNSLRGSGIFHNDEPTNFHKWAFCKIVKESPIVFSDDDIMENALIPRIDKPAGYVYICRDEDHREGWYKIGVATDVDARMEQLTGRGYNVHGGYKSKFSIYTLDSYQLERFLHDYFKSKRVSPQREIFDLTENQVKECIKLMEEKRIIDIAS